MRRIPPAFAAELRRFAYLGARYGPSWWLRYSPAPIGALALELADTQRDALASRLEWVFGRPPTRAELRLTFVNFAHCLAESLAGEDRAFRFEVSGSEELRSAMARGRGVILLTAHTGAWEFAAARFAKDFQEAVVLVMQAEDNPAARRVHEARRERNRVRTVYVGRDPLSGLQLVRELRSGGVVAFQIDRPAPSGRGIPTRLFGRDFVVPEGPFKLARATGAVIVTGFSSRRGFLHHRLDLEPPLELTRQANDAEIRAAAQTVIAALERFVARFPFQWFAFEPQGRKGAR